MKKMILLMFVSSFLLSGCGSAQNTDKNKKASKAKITVYYFHGTHRCPGCLASEDVALKSIKELYPDQMKNGTISFESVNIDEDKNKKLAEKYEVAWSTLLIVKEENGKEEKVNLTDEAFSYARTKPDKLKEMIKAAIDKMLKL